MIRFLGVIVLFFSLAASANDFCEKLDKASIADGARFDNTDNLYKVGGEGRLQFYSAPDEKCFVKGTFVVPGNDLFAYIEYEGFYRVMYLTEDGEQVIGWVNKNRLIATHKGLAPNYNQSK